MIWSKSRTIVLSRTIEDERSVGDRMLLGGRRIDLHAKGRIVKIIDSTYTRGRCGYVKGAAGYLRRPLGHHRQMRLYWVEEALYGGTSFRQSAVICG